VDAKDAYDEAVRIRKEKITYESFYTASNAELSYKEMRAKSIYVAAKKEYDDAKANETAIRNKQPPPREQQMTYYPTLNIGEKHAPLSAVPKIGDRILVCYHNVWSVANVISMKEAKRLTPKLWFAKEIKDTKDIMEDEHPVIRAFRLVDDNDEDSAVGMCIMQFDNVSRTGPQFNFNVRQITSPTEQKIQRTQNE